MSESEVLGAVERFLERREREPALTPEAFLAEQGTHSDELLAVLRAALDTEARLQAGAQERPHSIGPYRVLRTLGAGGMGVVLEVERDGQHFALKQLHPALAGERARARFRREAELLARLDHPGIVRVVERGEHQGEPYLVMQLVRGSQLSEAAAGLDLHARLELVAALAEALASVHAAGLLHRDLKPQNVLVGADGRPVLVDFGLGHDEDGATLTSTGDLLGTPRYMAPELALGREADARTDVWGLGQILYELVTGRPAIAEGSREAVLRDVARGRVLDPRKLLPDLSNELRRVLRTALAREPRRRYADAAALGLDLRRYLAGERVTARPPGALQNVADAARRRPELTLGLVIALLAALGLGARQLALQRAETREQRRIARVLLERAVIAWGQGEREGARRALETAARYDDGVATRELAAQLSSDEAPFDLRGLAQGAALADLLEARDLRLAGDLEAAAIQLDAVEGRAAASTAVAVERAALESERGDRVAALAHLRRAVGLDPGSIQLQRLLSAALFDAGRVTEGIDAERAAERLASAGEGVRPVTLARRLLRAPHHAELRDELERRLQDAPAAHDLRFSLAVLQDSDHLVAEAADSYTSLLELGGEDPWALTYLAHLRAGADSARCVQCRDAFALAPGLVDRAEAAQLMARAVRSDRGRDAGLLSTLVYLTRDHGLEVEVGAAMDEVLVAELPPADRARLVESRAGLRL